MEEIIISNGSKDITINKSSIGRDGLSAYQIAVNNGFEGSEQDWLNSLKATINSFVYNQNLPSADWIINYDPSYGVPSVTVIDSSNRIVLCEIDYPSSGVIEIKSSAPFVGKALINF